MKLLFAVSVLTCVGLAVAWGQDEKPAEGHGARRSPEEMMKRFDTNHDGKISLEEWKASPRSQRNPSRAEEMFKKLDTNHDGFITLDELKAHRFGEHRGEHGRGGRHSAPSASPSASISASP
jgi:hypothetical protein